MKKISKVVLLLILPGLLAHGAIFGLDSRKNISSVAASPGGTRAASVAIMLPNSNIAEKTAGFIDLELMPLSFTYNICPEEKESEELGFPQACSGFLIGEDILLTAGHCVLSMGGSAKNQKTTMCEDFSWYFGFEKDPNGKLQSNQIKSSEIYHCAEVIEAAFELPTQEKVTPADIGLDYAIVRLDKKVTGRKPLKWTPTRPRQNEPLTMIGHPLHRAKMMSSGRQLKNEKNYVTAVLDSFSGNSGSPVFDSKGNVFGILVRGYPDDHIWDIARQCNRTNHCSEDAKTCQLPEENSLMPQGDQVMPLELIKSLKSGIN